MNEQHLNLARAWRSKTFDELVGQELSVRVLKNSLYKNYIFPVYLFSGLRGCGKTTTARIFATALNCEKLEHFQQYPQTTVIPCLHCISCKAMALQQHPDFVEMDAASHTGVDNVRTIIDSASLLPSLGKKKIYLIDEAHMLSKAAFNAFLKLLEEPPLSVVFLLATTELHKIPETVRSRCLQLFFPALSVEKIVGHLEYICEREHIVYDTSGLLAVARAGQGSMRDALNIVERIRFAAGQVTGELTASLLGGVDTAVVVGFFEDMMQGGAQKDLFIRSVIKKNSVQPFVVWQAFVEFLSSLLTASYGVHEGIVYDKDRLENIKALYSQSLLSTLLDLLYDYEPLFVKTTQQASLLDLVIVKMQQIVLAHATLPVDSIVQEKKEYKHEPVIVEKEVIPLKKVVVSEEIKRVYDHQPEGWRQFVDRIDALQETVISSVFKQARWKDFQDSAITIQLDRKMSFFKDIVEENKLKWQPFVQEIFGASVTITIELVDGLSVSTRTSELPTPQSTVPLRETVKEHSTQRSRERVEEKPRFVSYKTTVQAQKQVGSLGPQAKKLLEHFPGTVTEYKE